MKHGRKDKQFDQELTEKIEKKAAEQRNVRNHERHETHENGRTENLQPQMDTRKRQESSGKASSHKEPSAAFGRNQIERTTKDTDHTKYKNDEKMDRTLICAN